MTDELRAEQTLAIDLILHFQDLMEDLKETVQDKESVPTYVVYV